MSLDEFERRAVELFWNVATFTSGILPPSISYLLDLVNELDEDPAEIEVAALTTAERCWADTGSC